MLSQVQEQPRRFLSLLTGWTQLAPHWKAAAFSFYHVIGEKITSHTQAMELKADSRCDSYLQGEVSACLTQALTEVAMTRPADPIHHLAHCLLTYRTLHPLKTELSPREHFRSSLPGSTESEETDADDPPGNDIFVHMSYRKALCSIGDIFDDDDIT
ncbi:uncharacterized protein LOC124146512 [Haliotis rufescens]|uniref:uncharacterized protein LOC124146512 n=1 Tax=Haliotis rufescens TaxID=6454 RepID=UPI00201EAF10|nr:uncharacterized protein LOC124146512 [Haliotis rufescens]